MQLNYNIYPLGDYALTIELGNTIDESLNQQAIALAHHLQQQIIIGVKDIIPAYASVTVVYDVFLINKQFNQPAYQFVKEQIIKAINTLHLIPQTLHRTIEIPVCYDICFGIDLEEIAAQKKLSVAEIIQLHCSKTYRVYMIGFLPGFAYMGTVDEKIATPRKRQPRINIDAGSVGIAGEQTGIYPFNSPGGWNIIGKTPLQLFDTKREEPVLLQAGDTIQFKSISITEFEGLK